MLKAATVQKVLLGREEIRVDPSVVITAYPVRGLDIGSSYVIYDALNEQKKTASAYSTSAKTLTSCSKLCDRIMVLCHGKVTGIVNARTRHKRANRPAYGRRKSNERYGEEVVENE